MKNINEDGEEQKSFGDKPRLHVPTFVARQKYPLAKSDEEALMLYMTDKEREDIAKLSNIDNKLEKTERELTKRIDALDNKVNMMTKESSMRNILDKLTTLEESPIVEGKSLAALKANLKQAEDRYYKIKDWNTAGTFDKEIKEKRARIKELKAEIAKKKKEVAEDASGGATSSGAVATVSPAMGQTQKRIKETENTSSKTAFQDGPNFYDSKTSKLIASYKDLVRGDYDVKGAKFARSEFLSDFPDYIMESTQRHIKEDNQNGMQTFDTTEEFINAAKAAGLNVFDDSWADAENGPHASDLEYNLWAVKGDSLESGDRYGVIGVSGNDVHPGVLFNDSNAFERWFHEDDQPVMSENNAPSEIERKLMNLDLDGFYKAANNAGYLDQRPDNAWADKEKLHFKKLMRLDGGNLRAIYDMVWYNEDENCMEKSGVIVDVGADGKLYADFTGVSEPIMNMNEAKAKADKEKQKKIKKLKEEVEQLKATLRERTRR